MCECSGKQISSRNYFFSVFSKASSHDKLILSVAGCNRAEMQSKKGQVSGF